MKKILFSTLTLAAAGAACAQSGPSMKFLAAPAVAVAAAQPALLRLHQGIHTTVVLKDAAPCGERASAPSYTVEGNSLKVQYQLAADTSAAHACVATTVFSFVNLPQREFQVAAQVTRTGARVLASAAPAGVPVPAPSLRFVSTPAVAALVPAQRLVLQSRNGGRMTVVVKEPAACGARPVEPSLSLGADSLRLRFELASTGVTPAAASCVATATFAVRNLPDRALRVEVADVATRRLAPVVANPVSMNFLAVPAMATVGLSPRDVFSARLGDRLTVVVREPAACGERAGEPSFELAGGRLAVHYALADEPAGDAAPCTAVMAFTFRGLSQPGLAVVARGTRTPLSTPVMLADNADTLR